MNKQVVSAIILSLGLAVAGLFVYCGIHQIASKDRAVLVKGLSTRDVQADYVVWPLEFGVRGNDISSLYSDLAAIEKTARAFFMDRGVITSANRNSTIHCAHLWSSQPLMWSV